jgi:hypothetical protein
LAFIDGPSSTRYLCFNKIIANNQATFIVVHDIEANYYHWEKLLITDSLGCYYFRKQKTNTMICSFEKNKINQLRDYLEAKYSMPDYKNIQNSFHSI